MRHSDTPINNDELKSLAVLEFMVNQSKDLMLNSKLSFEPDHLNRILDNLSEIDKLIQNYLQDFSVETDEYKLVEEYQTWCNNHDHKTVICVENFIHFKNNQ